LSSNEKIISGSEDKTIKIWTRDGVLKNTLTGHKGAIQCLKLFFSYGKLLSGSSDCTIKIWGLISGSCLNTLNGHLDSVLCLQLLPSGDLTSGCRDGSIKVWVLESGLNAFIESKKSSLNVYDSHKGPVKSLKLLSDDKLVSCSEDQTIKGKKFFYNP
jgi:WD40 repeat protein